MHLGVKPRCHTGRCNPARTPCDSRVIAVHNRFRRNPCGAWKSRLRVSGQARLFAEFSDQVVRSSLSAGGDSSGFFERGLACLTRRGERAHEDFAHFGWMKQGHSLPSLAEGAGL